jgi:hypothetical protein
MKISILQVRFKSRPPIFFKLLSGNFALENGYVSIIREKGSFKRGLKWVGKQK